MKRSLTALALLLALISCKAFKGDPGSAGAPGAQGPAGDRGPTGEPGQDATGVSVVALCPGSTVYPSTFVEVAFCIDGRLYGTYSANGGFSTELVPGAYLSNAIGSSCNFSVLANCEVTP